MPITLPPGTAIAFERLGMTAKEKSDVR